MLSKNKIKLKALEDIKNHNCYCYLCGKLIVSPQDLNLDHIIPKSKGGQTRGSNLKPTHHWCNTEKSNLTLWDFCIKKGFIKDE